MRQLADRAGFLPGQAGQFPGYGGAVPHQRLRLGAGVPGGVWTYPPAPFPNREGGDRGLGSGGFDVVIGNPPYVRSINLKENDPIVWDIYRSSYKSASEREWDIYLIFVEKGIKLLNYSGILGFILPNKFLNSQVGGNIRSILSAGNWLRKIVHFGSFQIFHGVTTYTCLLFLGHSEKPSPIDVARYNGPIAKSKTICPLPENEPELWKTYQKSENELSDKPWEFSATDQCILEKLKKWPNLEGFAQIFQGTGTRADKVFLVEYRGLKDPLVNIFSFETNKEYAIEPYLLKRCVRGRNISRYQTTNDNYLLIVPYIIEKDKGTLIPSKDFVASAPKTLEYLRECKPRLDERENGRFKGNNWYCYGRPQNLNRFVVSEKIILPDVVNRGECFLDANGRWLLDTAYAITLINNHRMNIRYFLGILNSPILTYFLRETGICFKRGIL